MEIYSVEDKLRRARTALLSRVHQIGYLTLALPSIIDETIDTAETNGEEYRFSPKFVKALTIEELTILYAHKVGHNMLLHFLRLEGRDIPLANKAMDYAVNALLMKFKITPLPCMLYDPKYNGMAFEQIYNILSKKSGQKQEQKPDTKQSKSSSPASQGQQNQDGGESKDKGKSEQKTGQKQEQKTGKAPENREQFLEHLKDNPGDFGKVTAPETPSQTKKEELKNKWTQTVQQSKALCLYSKEANEGAFTQIERVTTKRIQWREALAHALSERIKTDYTYRKPSRRSVGDIILPSLDGETIGEFAVIVDISGSRTLREIEQDLTDIQEIFAQYSNAKLILIFVNTQVTGTQEVTENDLPLKIKAKIGGRTCYKPGFKWLEEKEKNPKLAVYITDGYCNSFPQEPDFPVVWLITAKPKFTPPFGETLYYY